MRKHVSPEGMMMAVERMDVNIKVLIRIEHVCQKLHTY